MAITDRSVCPEPIPHRIVQLINMEVHALQIRDKTLPDRIRYKWISDLPSSGTTVLVNGRIDLALLANLDGVHLPETGLPLSTLRELGGDQMFFGQSTHSVEGAMQTIETGVDYVMFGPIYPTLSKPDLSLDEIPGLDQLNQLTNRTDCPVLAVGGISPDRVGECLEAGAYGVAGIRALFSPEDPTKPWQKIKNQIDNHGGDVQE